MCMTNRRRQSVGQVGRCEATAWRQLLGGVARPDRDRIASAAAGGIIFLDKWHSAKIASSRRRMANAVQRCGMREGLGDAVLI